MIQAADRGTGSLYSPRLDPLGSLEDTYNTVKLELLIVAHFKSLECAWYALNAQAKVVFVFLILTKNNISKIPES